AARSGRALPSAPRRAPLRRAVRRGRGVIPDLRARAKDARRARRARARVDRHVGDGALSRPRGLACHRALPHGAPGALRRAPLHARGRTPRALRGGGVTAPTPRTFQETLLRLEQFWSDQGCALLQPYSSEVGAGTFNPATFFRVLGPEPWKAAYVEPSRRPKDGRYGENPNRLQLFYQYQVVLKPA